MYQVAAWGSSLLKQEENSDVLKIISQNQ